MNFYLNKVIVAGNLGKDPEVRTMQSGGSLTNLTVAVGRSTKKDGQWVNETEWFNVVVWNEHLQKLNDKLSKGTPVYIEGELRTRKWTDKDGATKYSTEVVLGKFDGVLKIVEQQEVAERDTRTTRDNRKPSRAVKSTTWDDESDIIPF